MFILKSLLNLIDKGVIETREELEVFNHYAELETDRCGEFTYTDWQFLLREKLVYVNVSGLLDEEGYLYKEDFIHALEKHLPLEIQNPDFINNYDFLDEIEDEIREQVKNSFICSYGNSVWYEVLVDEDGKVFTIEGIGNMYRRFGKEVVCVTREENPFGNDFVEIGYENYLKIENLAVSEENFDEFLGICVNSDDFADYLDGVIEIFHKMLDEYFGVKQSDER